MRVRTQHVRHAHVLSCVFGLCFGLYNSIDRSVHRGICTAESSVYSLTRLSSLRAQETAEKLVQLLSELVMRPMYPCNCISIACDASCVYRCDSCCDTLTAHAPTCVGLCRQNHLCPLLTKPTSHAHQVTRRLSYMRHCLAVMWSISSQCKLRSTGTIGAWQNGRDVLRSCGGPRALVGARDTVCRRP